MKLNEIERIMRDSLVLEKLVKEINGGKNFTNSYQIAHFINVCRPEIEKEIYEKRRKEARAMFLSATVR